MALRRYNTVNEYVEKYIIRKESEEGSEKTQKTTKPTHKLESKLEVNQTLQIALTFSFLWQATFRVKVITEQSTKHNYIC